MTFSFGDRQHTFKICALLLAIALLAMQCVRMNGQGVVMDDAFISFRYARNLSNGLGLVFNEGERVEGYTNFLWVILLAASDRLGFNSVLSAKVFASASVLITLVLMLLMANHLLGPEESPWSAAMPLILFAGYPSQARYVVSGMETLLFGCLVTGAVYLHLKHRAFLSGFAFALAAMTRPEGGMYFALTAAFVILASWWLERDHIPLSNASIFMVTFSVVYGSYFLWRYQYFGYPLPNTFYAKASGFQVARLSRGWRLLVDVIGEWRVLPLLILSLFSLTVPIRRRVWLLFIGLVCATFAYFVWVGGDFLIWFGPRFLMPVFPLMLVSSAQGAHNLSRFVSAEEWIGQYALQGALLLLLFTNAFWFAWAADFSASGPFSVQMRGWTHLAHWLADNTPADSTMATDAAGIIPYYSERYAIDMFGLTDEHIAHLEIPITESSTVGHEKYDPNYILARKPDYIVSTWLNEQGDAVSAGLGSLEKEMEESYRLVAVAKVRQGLPEDGEWIVETSSYDQALYEAGYVSGVFQRIDTQ